MSQKLSDQVSGSRKVQMWWKSSQVVKHWISELQRKPNTLNNLGPSWHISSWSQRCFSCEESTIDNSSAMLWCFAHTSLCYIFLRWIRFRFSGNAEHFLADFEKGLREQVQSFPLCTEGCLSNQQQLFMHVLSSNADWRKRTTNRSFYTGTFFDAVVKNFAARASNLTWRPMESTKNTALSIPGIVSRFWRRVICIKTSIVTKVCVYFQLITFLCFRWFGTHPAPQACRSVGAWWGVCVCLSVRVVFVQVCMCVRVAFHVRLCACWFLGDLRSFWKKRAKLEQAKSNHL